MKFDTKKTIALVLSGLTCLSALTIARADTSVWTKAWSTPAGTGKTQCSATVKISTLTWDISSYIWSTSLDTGYSAGSLITTKTFSNNNNNVVVNTSVPIYNPLGTVVYYGSTKFNFWVENSELFSS